MTARLRRVAFGAITAVAMAAIVSITWAAVGDGGVLTLCYNKATLRAIDTAAGETCRPGEQLLHTYTKTGADGAFLASGGALDAGTLDSIDSTGFLLVGGTAANSLKLNGLDSSAYLGATATAANSVKLDGKDAAEFLLATGRAADSEKLAGIDSTGFVHGQGSYQRFVQRFVTPGESFHNIPNFVARLQLVCPSHIFERGAKWAFVNSNQDGVHGPRLNAWFQQTAAGFLSFFQIDGGTAIEGHTSFVHAPERFALMLADDRGHSAAIDVWAVGPIEHLAEDNTVNRTCLFAVQIQS